MAVAIRGTTPATSGANTPPSVTLTGARQPQTDDVLLIIEGDDWDQLADLGTPTVGGSTTGVTAVTNGSADGGQFFAHCKAWTKVITSGGSDLTVAFGTDGGVPDEEKCIVVYVLSGVDTSTPVDIAGGNFNSTGSTSHVAPSVTATVAGFLICHANDGNGASSGTSTAPGSMSEQYDAVVSGSMAYTGATEQLAGAGATGTRTFSKTGNATYAALSIVINPAAAAASIPFNPQRTVTTRDPGEAWWTQKDRRNANLVATAANDLAQPLFQPADALYWHLYDDSTRDRSARPQQRTYYDPSLLTPAAAMPSPPPQRTAPVRDYGEAQWLQPARRDVSLLASALLESPLVWVRPQPAISDRREVPAQRPYISDPSFYPLVPPADPLTLAWGAGGNYWHLYNDIRVERRIVPQQREYVSDPGLLLTAQLEGPLLWTRPQQPITDRRATVAQPRWFDPSLLAQFADVLPADVWRRLLPATHADRRETPVQPPRWTLYFDAGPGSPPLTLAWGAGGSLWHRYNPRWPTRMRPVQIPAAAAITIARNITFTTGAPATGWHAGDPRAGWLADPPRTGWQAGGPRA